MIGAHLLEEVSMALWVTAIEAMGQHGHRETPAIERTTVCGTIHTNGKPRHHSAPVGGQVMSEIVRGGPPRRGGRPCSHDGNPAQLIDAR